MTALGSSKRSSSGAPPEGLGASPWDCSTGKLQSNKSHERAALSGSNCSSSDTLVEGRAASPWDCSSGKLQSCGLYGKAALGGSTQSSSGVLPQGLGLAARESREAGSPAQQPWGEEGQGSNPGLRRMPLLPLEDRDDSYGAMGFPVLTPPRPVACPRAASGETWLLMELCDRGSLQVR